MFIAMAFAIIMAIVFAALGWLRSAPELECSFRLYPAQRAQQRTRAQQPQQVNFGAPH